MVLSIQEQLAKMNENYENLIEQIRVANLNQFGRKSERLNVLESQMSFFIEANTCQKRRLASRSSKKLSAAGSPKRKASVKRRSKTFL